jgi:acetyl-CoA acetyltransferase
VSARTSGAYAIAGIGETAVGKLPEQTTTGLALAAARAAILDAGLTVGEIDGIVCDQPNNLPYRSYALALARNLGIAPSYATDIALGGASPAGCVIHAIMAIAAGLCTTVVGIHTQKQATGRSEARHGQLSDGLEDYEEPFGLTSAVSQHATVAARHMHEFGTTSEQLAAVAVAFRKHAALNPAAMMRAPIGIEDVLASRWITKPLHLLDCCLVSDGAGAVVLTTSERARSLRKRPVYVAGFGLGFTAGPLEMPTLTTLGGAKSSATAYAMSGLGPDDVDFAELYDCFTIIPLVTLEDYGFCAKGEGGAFVSGGRIELGGALPVNTHGGLLSQGHVEGMLHLTEAVKQLRGGEVEPERQVPDAKVGIVSGHGATLSAHATLLLTAEPTA